jgi:hypothetical protein
MEKVYKVKVRYVFEGTFEIEARSKAEARDIAEKSCGMTCGDIQAVDVGVQDWEFPVHPDKTIKSVTL